MEKAMYYLLAHVYFYRSLKILHGREPAALLERLSALANQKGLRTSAERDGYLLLALDEKRERAEMVLLDTVALMEENMSVSTDWLNGYSILLERLDTAEPEEAFQTLRQAAFLACQENKAWICPQLLKEKRQEWKLSASEVPVILRRSLIPIAPDTEETLMEKMGKGPLLAALTHSWSEAKKDKGPLCFVHPDTEALWLHLRQILPAGWHADELTKPLEWQDPLAHLVAGLDTDPAHPFPLREDYTGDDWETDAIEACTTWFESHPAKKGRRFLVFQRFSEWPGVFLKFWEKVLRSGAKWVKPIFLETSPPQKIGLGEPINLSTHAADDAFGPEGLSGLVTGLDPLLKKILYLFSLGDGLAYPETVIDFLTKQGEDKGIVLDKIARLERYGLFQCIPAISVLNKNWASALTQFLYEDAGTLAASFAQYLMQNLRGSDRIAVRMTLCVRAGLGTEALALAGQWARILICRRSTFFLQILQSESLSALFSTRPDWQKAWQTTGASLKLRYALEQEGREWKPQTWDSFQKKIPDREYAEHDPEWVCHSGRLLLATGSGEEGFHRIKIAYGLAQQSRDKETEIFSAMEIGRSLLKKKKLDEASEYFGMAIREADKAGLQLLYTQSLLLAGASRFLIGNLHSSGEYFHTAREVAKRYSLKSHENAALFLAGRHAFDMGQYEAAGKLFDAATGALGKTAALWSARCLVYLGQPETARKALESEVPNRESEFFLAEALYFSGKTAEAAALATRWKGDSVGSPSWRGLSWAFDNGFQSLEDLSLDGFNDEQVLVRLSGAFRDYLLLLESPDKQPDAMARLDRLCSDKSLSQRDPHTHLYFLWLGLVVGEGQSVKNARWSTVMGRGLKELQTRGSKVDNRDDRVGYLNSPYWNALFLSEARKHKLL